MSLVVCPQVFIDAAQINAFIPGNGSFILGMTRIISFSILMFLNWRNKLLLIKNDNPYESSKNIMLPAYFFYIYTLMIMDGIAGIINIFLSLLNPSNLNNINSWILPIESGIFHAYYEGLAIFLLRYTASRSAFLWSMLYGSLWGIFTEVIILTEVQLQFISSSFNISGIQYGMFIFYCILLLIFYMGLTILPMETLYRRPAMKRYSSFNIILQLFWIMSSTIIEFTSNDAQCAITIVGIILIGFAQVIIVWYTLLLDSQYWQGLKPDDNNPFAKVWDQLDIDTASAIGEISINHSMTTTNTNTNATSDKKAKISFLHFGLIEIDQNIGYISGGFSRVYFGTLRKKQKIALKVLFSIELSSLSINEFCTEAKLLYSLQHENIVSCYGLCLMPPALSMVLENCEFGSLFDFIYKVQSKVRYENSKRITPLAKIESSKSSSTRNPLSSWKDKDDSNTNKPLTSIEEYKTNRITWGIRNPSTIPPNTNSLWNVFDGVDSDGSSRYSDTSTHHIANRESDISLSNLSDFDIAASSIKIKTSPKKGKDMKLIGLEIENIGQRESTNSVYSSRMSQSLDTARASIVSLSAIATRKLQQLVKAGLAFGMKPIETEDLSQLPPAFALSFLQRLHMIQDAIRSIAYLHSQGYIHCDIKSLNFLVTKDLVVKLSDFGESRAMNVKPKRDIPPIAAINWAPPEVSINYIY